MKPAATTITAPGRSVRATPPEQHTMGDRLADYVLPKIPVGDLCACRGQARVTPRATPATLTDPRKVGVKRFNWRRPSFRREDGVLICDVLPGVDYTWHYARLIASAATMLGFEPAVTVEPVDPAAAVEFITATMPASLVVPDIVVLGYVEHLFPTQGTWRTERGFGWRQINLSGKRIALVGVEFSFWGDLAGAVVSALATRRARWVIYVGKLGTLQPGREPNRWAATGGCSLVEGRQVKWNSRLADVARAQGLVLTDQRHITVASIVDETRAWYKAATGRFDLVDPEIGRMAIAANDAGIAFDYLRIVSDNLTGHYNAGLYHERSPDVRAARLRCLDVIESTLARSLA